MFGLLRNLFATSPPSPIYTAIRSTDYAVTISECNFVCQAIDSKSNAYCVAYDVSRVVLLQRTEVIFLKPGANPLGAAVADNGNWVVCTRSNLTASDTRGKTLLTRNFRNLPDKVMISPCGSFTAVQSFGGNFTALDLVQSRELFHRSDLNIVSVEFEAEKQGLLCRSEVDANSRFTLDGKKAKCFEMYNP